jgi:hypothetical protein
MRWTGKSKSENPQGKPIVMNVEPLRWMVREADSGGSVRAVLASVFLVAQPLPADWNRLLRRLESRPRTA